jgi:hypothetical protein
MAWALSVNRRDGQNRMAKTGLVHVRHRLGNTMKPVQLLESVPGVASVAYMASDDTTNEALAQAMSPKRVLWMIGRGSHVQTRPITLSHSMSGQTNGMLG